MPYLLAWCCKSTKKVLFAKAFALKNEETFFAFERMEVFFSVAHMAKRVFTADSSPFYSAHHSRFNSFLHSASSVFSHKQCFTLYQRLNTGEKVEDFFAKQVGFG